MLLCTSAVVIISYCYGCYGCYTSYGFKILAIGYNQHSYIYYSYNAVTMILELLRAHDDYYIMQGKCWGCLAPPIEKLGVL